MRRGVNTALLAIGLALAPGRNARAEPWELAEANNVVTVAAYSTPEGAGPRLVRIGVVFDPRVNHSESTARERVDAMRHIAAAFTAEGIHIAVTPVAVDAPENLRERLEPLALNILVLPDELRPPEWQALLDVALQLHLRTIATVSEPAPRGEHIRRRGAAVYVARGLDGRPRRYSDRERARLEGSAGTRALYYTTPLDPRPAAPPSEAAPASPTTPPTAAPPGGAP